MKWTTANIKSPNYTANHELYVGAPTGSFKKLVPAYKDNPFVQHNLQDLKEFEPNVRVTALAYGNNNSEVLIGRTNNKVQLYSLDSNEVEHTFSVKISPVVGVARYDDVLIAGLGNGEVQCINMSLQDATEDDSLIISSGNNMAHMRQCAVQRNLIATGGKERQNNLKIFDVAADGKQVFSSKNLPNDFLQLEVPVWDCDVGFIDSPYVLATCSRLGYVRVYDTRKQRRPVQCYSNENQMSFTTLSAQGNYIYTGTTMGALKAFDIRRMNTFVHTYKGFTGAITDLSLDESGKYLASSSLDRYVRVHHTDSTVLLYQCYVKSKAASVLIRASEENPDAKAMESAEEDESTKTQKKSKTPQKSVSDDEEYEEMFDNMQTVCENDDKNEDGSANEGVETNEKQVGTKRKKSEKPSKSNKKKRN